MAQTTISPKSSLNSKFITINGSKMHYIEAGEGDPILFLHGMPASSYVWRNIIPAVCEKARCLAPDLIGMGQSDKPDISYDIQSHIQYIDAFIKALNLKNVTLVVHGLGSIIGFNYAAQNTDNIRAIAFYESYLGELDSWQKFSLPMQQLMTALQNHPDHSSTLEDKNLIKKIFNIACLRKLSQEEFENYSQPFLQSSDRKALEYYVKEFPFGSKDPQIVQLILNYTNYLQQSAVPKLMLYHVPGFITSIAQVEWCKEHFKNLTLADLGEGLHFVQEYNPQEFSQALLNWYNSFTQSR